MSSPPEAGVDFFACGALPVPRVTIQDAERIAKSSFGLTVRAELLGSQQDSNFLLVAAGGAVAGVLKVANPAFSAAEIEAQDAAAGLVDAVDGQDGPALRASTVRHAPVTVTVDGEPALARVLTYLPGGTLIGAGYLSPRVVAGLGAVAGQVSRALRSFTHPGLDRVLQWDLRHADRVVSVLAPHVRDAGLRARVTDAAGAAWTQVQALAGDLPVQAPGWRVWGWGEYGGQGWPRGVGMGTGWVTMGLEWLSVGVWGSAGGIMWRSGTV